MSIIKGTPTSWSWGDLIAGDIPDLSGTYQAVSEKNAANGYCGLDAGGLVANADLQTTVVLEGDIETIPGDGHTTSPISSSWAYDHGQAADPHTVYQKESEKNANNGYCGLDAGGLVANADLQTTVVLEGDIETIPGDGHTTSPISSSWAYDHGQAADPHTVYQKESEKNANNGYCGLDAGGLVANADLQTTVILEADVDDVAVDGATTAPVSSNWAYDHLNIAGEPHTNATSIGGYSFGVTFDTLFLIDTDHLTDGNFLVGNGSVVGGRVLADGDIPAAIARDAEVPGLASAQVVTGANLPTASAAYVGILKIHRVTGNNKSSIYICVQNDEATPAYEWVQLAIST